jgi:hypothetical protein
LRQDPMRLEPVPPEPPRLPREPMAAEPARTTPIEPLRSAPPVSAERYRPDFDREAQAVPASMPPEPVFSPAVAPEPRHTTQPLPAPAYEPVLQTSSAPGLKRPAASPLIEPVPPGLEPRETPIGVPAATVSPPAYETAYQAPAEPPRVPPIRTPAEPREPRFEPTVMQEAHRPQTAPPRPSQNDKNNLAEMAQRLEAALRRPTRPVEPVPPASPPRATTRFEPAAIPAPWATAPFDPPATPAPPAAAEPGGAAITNLQAPAGSRRPAAAAGLEAEIANLLGRPAGGT